MLVWAIPALNTQSTRHNIGFTLIDAFQKRHAATAWKLSERFNAALACILIEDGTLLLVKPATYMNRSGIALNALCSYYKISVEKLVVIYDEINLPLGKIKISLSGSAGGHNGVADILARLGNGFTRYRLGIGPKAPAVISLNDFVLGPFTAEQNTLIENHIPEWLDGLDCIVRQGPVAAMNQLNRRPKVTEKDKEKNETES